MTRADSFLRRACGIFLSLAVLYGLYALQALDDFPASVSMPRRLMMTANSAMVVLALLVPPSVFAAAVHRFDLFDETTPGNRRREWTVLFAVAFAAYLSSTIGPLAAAANSSFSFAERPVSGIAAMFFAPVALGIFSIVSGIAGALVGQLTKWMIPWRRQVARWAVCLALLFVFCASVLAVDVLVARHGWPVAWLFAVGPPVAPVAAAWVMLRVQGYRVRDLLPVPAMGTKRRPLGPEALDGLATMVVGPGGEAKMDGEMAAPVFSSKAESEMAAFLSGFRRVALPDVTVSDAQVVRIVEAVVAAAPDTSPVPKPVVPQTVASGRRRFDLGTAGELGVSWVGLAAGLLSLGIVGGVAPHVGAAVGIGLLGSVASVWVARRKQVPVPALTTIAAATCLFVSVSPELGATHLIDMHMAGRGGAQVPERQAREVLRLGDSADVPEWAAFVREPELVVDAAGRLYVRPLGNARVNVIDEHGDFVRYVGRKGSGPGEFTVINDMGLAADTLWMRDWPPERTSFFDSNGTHLRTEATVPPYEWLEPGHDGKTIPLRDGRALFVAPRATDDPSGRALVPLMVGVRQPAEKRDTVAYRFHSTGMILMGVGTFHWEPVVLSPLVAPLARGNGVAIASWTADRLGEVVLRRFGHDGDLLREDTLAFSVTEISSQARDQIISEGVEKARGPYESHRERFGDTPSNLRDAVVEALALPSHYSPVQDMFATPDDRIWLRATAVEGQSEGDESHSGGDWFVVDSDGSVAFRVRPPSGVTFKAARGNQVWGVGKGYMETPYIALYELSETPRG